MSPAKRRFSGRIAVVSQQSPERLRALFDQAVLLPESRRSDFLRTECGDDTATFAEVMELLSHSSQPSSSSVLGSPDSTGDPPLPETTTLPPLSPPAVFNGTARFRVHRRIGAGAFGVVYEATDLSKRSVVALKLLQNRSPDSLYRFKQEFRALADVTHANLVKLYELASEGNHWFFTMELVHGRHFLEYVRDERRHEVGRKAVAPSPSHNVVDFESRLRESLRQLVQGLIGLHSSGHLHRDIKPSNVLVEPGGRVVILDFGLVVDVENEASLQSRVIAGTPAYMSPEQAAGLPLTRASDWYSVGVMLYEALTGTQPYAGSYLKILADKQCTDPVRASDVASHVAADLDELCHVLLARDPSRRPSGEEVLDLLGARSFRGEREQQLRRDVRHRTTTFIGRANEQAVLRQAFEGVCDGTPAIVAISGPSGIGKTSLLNSFLGSVRVNYPNAVVLRGRCYEREAVPYKALDSLVDALSRYLKQIMPHEVTAVLPRDIASLALLFPILGQFDDRSSHRPATPLDSQETRRRAYAASKELFARIGDRQPLVVSIDDLQWGDVDSAALLGEVMRGPDPPVLMFIASYRDVELESSPFLRTFLPNASRGENHWVSVPLAPLTVRESVDLASSLLSTSTVLDLGIAAAIATEAGGSPFFIDELVRFAEFSGDLGSDRLADPPLDSAAREASVENMIKIRLARLPLSAQRVLQCVAVNGRPVAESVLRDAVSDSVEESDLLTLRTEHLLRGRGPGDRAEFEMYHDRIREIVVSTIPAEPLRAVHLALATALERDLSADPELLAEHFEGAGELTQAARYVTTAAEHAERALAFDRAARLYRKALAFPHTPEATRRTLLANLGRVLANGGRGIEAAEAFLSVSEGSSSAEGLEYRVKAAQHLLFAGQLRQGLAVTREVLDSIGMKLPDSRWGILWQLLVGRLRLRARGLRFDAKSANDVGSGELMKVDACWSVSAGLSIVDTARGAVFQTRHLLMALDSGEPDRVHRALCSEMAFVAARGSGSARRVQRLQALSEDLSRRLNTPYARGLQLFANGCTQYLRGEWKAAASGMRDAERILTSECTGVTWEVDNARLFNLWCLYQLGDCRGLGARFDGLLADAEERGDLYAATALRAWFAPLVCLAMDEPDRALGHLSEAMTKWAQPGFQMPHLWALFSSVNVLMYQGMAPAAWERLERTWGALKRSLLLQAQMMSILMHDAKGRCALAAAGECEDKRRRNGLLKIAMSSAKALERNRVQWALPLALMIRAGVAYSQEHSEVASDLLSRAEDGLSRLDMHLHSAVAKRRRGHLRGSLSAVAESDTWMASQGIKEPTRLSRVFAPWGEPMSIRVNA